MHGRDQYELSYTISLKRLLSWFVDIFPDFKKFVDGMTMCKDYDMVDYTRQSKLLGKLDKTYPTNRYDLLQSLLKINIGNENDSNTSSAYSDSDDDSNKLNHSTVGTVSLVQDQSIVSTMDVDSNKPNDSADADSNNVNGSTVDTLSDENIGTTMVAGLNKVNENTMINEDTNNQDVLSTCDTDNVSNSKPLLMEGITINPLGNNDEHKNSAKMQHEVIDVESNSDEDNFFYCNS